jgi:oligopeptide/dipeptide ABC transporter ATP-binding protein
MVGAPAIITHCGFIPETPKSPLYMEVLDALGEIASYCNDLGIGFWFETGQETPVTLLRTIQDINLPNLGINLDTANIILYGKGNPLDSLDPVICVGNQISEAIMLDHIPREDALRKAVDIMNDTQIADSEQRAQNFPFELSGGMRQRIMIGMMISRNPKLIIADEPTTALDVTIQAQILDLLTDLKEKQDVSVLLITHNFGVVAEVADRIGVMYAGTLVEEGDVFTLFENPKHPYTRMLIKALPTIRKHEGRLAVIPGTVGGLIDPKKGCRFANRCPYATEKCVEEPALWHTEGDHRWACHLEGGELA